MHSLSNTGCFHLSARKNKINIIILTTTTSHQVHITHMSCATWSEGTAQLLFLTDLYKTVLIFFCISLVKSLTDKGWVKNGVPGKKNRQRTPEKLHTEALKFKPQLIFEPALLHWLHLLHIVSTLLTLTMQADYK